MLRLPVGSDTPRVWDVVVRALATTLLGQALATARELGLANVEYRAVALLGEPE